VTKKQDLAIHIANELASQFNVGENVKEKIRQWMKNFYRDIRSTHTHTGQTDYSKITKNGLREIDVAGMMYELLIDLQYLFDSFHKYVINTRVIEIFQSQEMFEEIQRLLTKKKAKEYFYNCDDHEFKKIHIQLSDFAAYCRPEFVTKKNQNKIFSSLKTLVLILEHFCNTYCTGFNPYLESIQGIYLHIKSSKTFEDAIDKMPTHFSKESDKLEKIEVRKNVSIKLILRVFEQLRFLH